MVEGKLAINQGVISTLSHGSESLLPGVSDRRFFCLIQNGDVLLARFQIYDRLVHARCHRDVPFVSDALSPSIFRVCADRACI